MPDAATIAPDHAALPDAPAPVGYSVVAAAAAFVPPISAPRIRAAISDGSLPCHRFGNGARILRIDLENWVRTLPKYMRTRRSRTEENPYD